MNPEPGISGVISQHIYYQGTISVRDKEKIRTYNENELFASYKSYTEYWPVFASWSNDNAEREFIYKNGKINYTDEFSNDPSKSAINWQCSKGDITITAEAEFIPYGEVPNSAVQKESPAAALPHTMGRNITGNNPKYTRVAHITWNCLDSTTLKARKVNISRG